MSGLSTRKRLSLWLTLLLSLCALAPYGCQDAVSAVAHVRAVKGDVTWKINDEGAPQPAEPEVSLPEGSLVITQEGTAQIEFAGGNFLDLQPNTTLVIRKAGGTAAQFGAVLLSGNATASSKGRGVLLAIGTPFGLTEFGTQELSFEISHLNGLHVLIGEVSVIDAGGQRTTLGAGDDFVIPGVTVVLRRCSADSDCKDNEACDLETSHCILKLEPIQFVLLANPQQVQVLRAGESTWRSPKKRDFLARGDMVRTRKASTTQIQLGDVAELKLRPQTQMILNDAGLSKESHRAKYGLESGSVLIHVDQNSEVGARHELEVAGLVMKVEPGLKEATVEVNAPTKDKAQIKVHFGRATLSDGTVVEAGRAVTIEKGVVITTSAPLAVTGVELKPKSSSIIYYTSSIPPILFNWKAEEGAESYELEIAKDRDFDKRVFREKVSTNSFVHERFPAGRFYWRVKGTGNWIRGMLSVEKKTDNTNQPKHHNKVVDTGEKTVIYYQKALPDLTFTWKAVEGATQYRLRIYPDGEFDKPMVEQESAENTKYFAKGRFPEGKYFWQQSALAADGSELKTGKMNTLQIAYDNAITDLDVKSPRPDMRTRSKTVSTYGELQLGAKLSINGKRAGLDSKGRFREVIPLNKGNNQIVYTTISSDGIERFYVRNVTRH
ncbi:MAG: hypothetical protein A2289_20090 [Deltaproteobacteria bacterium RIFOXYA12_FULL_58_15]|nr:MAG: hypothetical protein A2289_20090 [Deltaproteobacteria bacterium RIFOXYA12_FULL_58_15]OGR07151.1 MAG: hypothetical protein A2341_03385 [Deltaproteobacteria bacterium RIFOXYB12_FULL_58_9]